MGMLLTNSNLLYKKYCKVYNLKVTYSHYEFVCNIAKAWLNISVYIYFILFFQIMKSDYIFMQPEDYFLRFRSGASTVSSKTAIEFITEEEVVDKPIISRRRLRETELSQVIPVSKRRWDGLTGVSYTHGQQTQRFAKRRWSCCASTVTLIYAICVGDFFTKLRI